MIGKYHIKIGIPIARAWLCCFVRGARFYILKFLDLQKLAILYFSPKIFLQKVSSSSLVFRCYCYISTVHFRSILRRSIFNVKVLVLVTYTFSFCV